MERAPTVADAIRGFTDDLALEGRASTSASYRSQLKPLHRLPPLSVAAIGTPELRALFADRMTEVAPSTLCTFHAVCRAFFRWVKEEGYRHDNPMDGVPKPKQRRPPHRFLDVSQMRRLFAACRTDQERLIVLLLGAVGLRVGELCGLRWRDIDADAGTIRVLGKGSKWRELAPDPPVFAALGRMPRHEGVPAVGFTGRSTAEYHIQKLGKRAGLGHVHPHMLRHSFACNWLELTGDAASLQELLGHADGQMTAHYTRTVRQRSALRKQRQVNLAARLFGESPENPPK